MQRIRLKRKNWIKLKMLYLSHFKRKRDAVSIILTIIFWFLKNMHICFQKNATKIRKTRLNEFLPLTNPIKFLEHQMTTAAKLCYFVFYVKYQKISRVSHSNFWKWNHYDIILNWKSDMHFFRRISTPMILL